MIRPDRPLAAAQALDAPHAEDVRLDALDVGAERAEEAAEVLHVRLAGRVADRRLALGERRGHDDVLGRHDARLVEEDACAADALGTHLVRVARLDLDAQLREAVDVRVEPAPADDVAARRRDDRGACANEQRACEQERCPHPRAQLGIELRLANVGGVDADVVRADPLDVGAEVVDQREHRVDVPDARDVVQHDRLGRHHTRGQDGQHAVLVARGGHAAVEGLAAFDQE